MGLFNFIKDVGAAVFSESQEVSNEQTEKKIVDFVNSNFHFGISDFVVDVKNEIAYLKGTATTSEEREKIILAVGNIEGIAQVNDDELTSEGLVMSEPRFYTVQQGDSLSKIAQEYYNDPMKYVEIFEANKPMLEDPDKIYPGQTLRIPESIV